MTASFDQRLNRLHRGSNDPNDMLYVGWCLVHGDETPPNVLEGIRWWTAAADSGSGEACLRLADLYVAGEQVTRSCTEAENWYERAARSEGFRGVYGLATAHALGNECVKPDPEKALHYFEIAADRGHLVSKIQRAKLLRRGLRGAAGRLMGWVQIVPLAIEGMLVVVKGDPEERLWDAHRWFPDSPFIGKLRKGTRFE